MRTAMRLWKAEELYFFRTAIWSFRNQLRASARARATLASLSMSWIKSSNASCESVEM